MALGAAEILAPLLAENQDLIGAVMLKHGGCDARAFDQRLAQLQAVVAAHGQHVGQFNNLAGWRRKPLDLYDIARRNAVLLPAGLYNSEHGFLIPDFMLVEALTASARHYSAVECTVNMRRTSYPPVHRLLRRLVPPA